MLQDAFSLIGSDFGRILLILLFTCVDACVGDLSKGQGWIVFIAALHWDWTGAYDTPMLLSAA